MELKVYKQRPRAPVLDDGPRFTTEIVARELENNIVGLSSRIKVMHNYKSKYSADLKRELMRMRTVLNSYLEPARQDRLTPEDIDYIKRLLKSLD